MNFKQAITIMELSDKFTEEDLKRQFKKLASKYHPDINKDPSAIQKSKEISEAYNFLKDKKNWENLFVKVPFNKVKVNFREVAANEFIKKVQNIKLNQIPLKHIKISFVDSMLGCEVKTDVNWIEKCTQCPPEGTCTVCNGAKRYEKGGLWNLKLAAGIQHGTIITLEKTLNNQLYKFLFKVLIEGSDKFKRQGNDVISKENITLLHALKGGPLNVKLLSGEGQIEIKPLTKNNEIVIVKGGGIPGLGDHHIIINVNYPSNTKDLIKLLEEGK